MTRRTVIPALFFACAVFSTVAITGCGANLVSDPVQIQLAVDTNDCIDVLDADTAPGQYLILYACGAGKMSQEWMLNRIGDTDVFDVQNENSKLCMTVSYPYDTYPGQAIIQAPCDITNIDMQWTIHSTSNGWEFRNQASGMCLDDPYGATDPPDTYHIQQYTCTPGDPGQSWIDNPVGVGDTP